MRIIHQTPHLGGSSPVPDPPGGARV